MSSEKADRFATLCQGWIDRDLDAMVPIIRETLSDSRIEKRFFDLVADQTPTTETIVFSEELIASRAISLQKDARLIGSILTACCEPKCDLALIAELFQRCDAFVFPAKSPRNWIKDTIQSMAKTKRGLAALKMIMTSEVGHATQRRVIKFVTRAVCDGYYPVIAPEQAIKVGVWVDTQILPIIADAQNLQSRFHEDAVCFLIDLLGWLTKKRYLKSIRWLADLAPEYLGHLVTGQASPETVPEWCRVEHLIQHLIRGHYECANEARLRDVSTGCKESEEMAINNMVLRRIAEQPENWLPLFEIEADDTCTLWEACESGWLKINAIGLFQMTYQDNSDLKMIWGHLDPSTCLTIRSNLHSMTTWAIEQHDLGGSLETWTEYGCRCLEIGGTVDHTDHPLPVIQDRHVILSDLVMRIRFAQANKPDTTPPLVKSLGQLAKYTRNHDLAVHYYLVNNLVILVHSPGIRYPAPNALRVVRPTIRPTKIMHHQRPVYAIDLFQQRAPDPAYLLAAVNSIFAKNARS